MSDFDFQFKTALQHGLHGIKTSSLMWIFKVGFRIMVWKLVKGPNQKHNKVKKSIFCQTLFVLHML
jgi:hypothetical protein